MCCCRVHPCSTCLRGITNQAGGLFPLLLVLLKKTQQNNLLKRLHKTCCNPMLTKCVSECAGFKQSIKHPFSSRLICDPLLGMEEDLFHNAPRVDCKLTKTVWHVHQLHPNPQPTHMTSPCDLCIQDTDKSFTHNRLTRFCWSQLMKSKSDSKEEKRYEKKKQKHLCVCWWVHRLHGEYLAVMCNVLTLLCFDFFSRQNCSWGPPGQPEGLRSSKTL